MDVEKIVHDERVVSEVGNFETEDCGFWGF